MAEQWREIRNAYGTERFPDSVNTSDDNLLTTNVHVYQTNDSGYIKWARL
jgi:hypothetical protein